MEKKIYFDSKKTRSLFTALFILISSATFSQSYYNYTNNLFPIGDTAITQSRVVVYDDFNRTFYAGTYTTIDPITLNKVNGIVIWRVNSAGTITTKTFYQYSSFGAGDNVIAMKIISNNLYVLINGFYDLTLDYDAVLVKYDLSLNYQWQKSYNSIGNSDDIPISLQAGPSNSILILFGSLGNFITQRYNALGTLLYTKTFDSGVDEYPVAMQYYNNAIYVVGTKVDGLGGTKVQLIKYNNSLGQLWQKSLSVSGVGAIDYVNDLRIDLNSNIYIAGAYHNGINLNPFILKYEPTSGVKKWTKKIVSGGNSANRIFVDDIGNPIVYLGPAINRYVRLDQNTGLVTLNIALFTNPKGQFQFYDAQKGNGNDIYAFGNYDTTITVAGASSIYSGIAITRITTDGSRKWTYVNTSIRPDLTYRATNFIVKDSISVFFCTDNEDLSIIPYDKFSGFGAKSALTGLRLGEDEIVNNKNSKSPIIISPNPATNEIQVFLSDEFLNDSRLTIYDLTGKVVLKESIINNSDNNSFILNIQDYPSGLYVAKIENSGNIYTTKFVKAE